ncbi:MAG TPA: c-type cytochrome [Gemmatimonadaceae bacterium]|nr:c-type cytochrome [Gemmatimonadaceae bacterium]
MSHLLSMTVLLALPACTPGAPGVGVETALITVPVGGAPALVFATVRNADVMPLYLETVSVDGEGPVTIRTEAAHRDAPRDAPPARLPTLTPVERLLLPVASQLRLAPGSYTGVLESDTTHLTRGETRTLTLRFERAQPVSVTARVVDYADLDSLLRPAGAAVDTTAPTVEAGRALFASDGCGACHGALGHGDGPAGRALMPPPRDFRAPDAFRNGGDVDAIAQTLATGLPGGGAMPLYPHLTLRERRSLALFVQSLRLTSPSAGVSNP